MTVRSSPSDNAKLNFDKIVDEMTGEMTEIFSRAVDYIPLRAIDGECGLRSDLALRG